MLADDKSHRPPVEGPRRLRILDVFQRAIAPNQRRQLSGDAIPIGRVCFPIDQSRVWGKLGRVAVTTQRPSAQQASRVKSCWRISWWSWSLLLSPVRAVTQRLTNDTADTGGTPACRGWTLWDTVPCLVMIFAVAFRADAPFPY